MDNRKWKRFLIISPLVFLFSLHPEIAGAEAREPIQAQDQNCKPFDHDHAVWTQFLKKWVKDDSLNYDGAKKSGAMLLKRYLADLEAVCKKDIKRWKKKQRLAFWINVYNAYTVKLILDNYPIKSIRKIGVFPGAAWRHKFILLKRLKVKNFSLSHVENDIIRTR